MSIRTLKLLNIRQTQQHPFLTSLQSSFEYFLLSCDIPNVLFIVVPLLVICLSIVVAQFMLASRLLKDNRDIKRELIKLRAELSECLKTAGVIIVTMCASAPIVSALIDLVYEYCAYDIWGVQAFLVGALLSGVFGAVAY